MEQLIEMLKQIQEISGVAIDALEQAGGKGGEKEPGGAPDQGDAGGREPSGAPDKGDMPMHQGGGGQPPQRGGGQPPQREGGGGGGGKPPWAKG